MAADVGTRYGKQDRTELQKEIPLDTPFLVFIDPSSMCNLRCKFCPCGGGNKETWSREKKTGVLSYELYRKVIDDLAEFPRKIKTLRLYKEGEPLLNKRLPDMIHYARKKDVTTRIDFTTNGTLFNRSLNLAILDAGLDRINISIEALDEQGYYDVSGIKVDYNKLLDNIGHLYSHRGSCHIFIKISDYGLGNHSAQEFYDIFGAIADEMAVEHVTPVWPEFDLNKVESSKNHDIYGAQMNDRKPVQVCPYLFYSLCVNSDGTVSACLMDWNHKLIVGDVSKSSIHEIWGGEKMQEMRRNHLLLRKGLYNPCSKCGQLEYAVLDNIDPYREELLERLSK